MTSQRTILVAATALLGTGLIASSPALAIDPTNMAVSATVTAACTFTAVPLDFGDYQIGRTTDLSGQSRIEFSNCVPGPYEIEITATEFGANVNTPLMQHEGAGPPLPFFIHRDSPTGDMWNVNSLHALASSSGEIDVYGVIPGNQEAAVGTYSGSITFSITLP